jgi:diadenosine tetraphosphate (Ap4A) HIT family hydrolase
MRAEKCPFCHVSEDRIIAGNGRLLAIADKYPVAKGHTLVIPKRHVASIFDLEATEYDQMWQLVIDVRQLIADKFEPTAFNIGVNDGQAAGQTIEHAHVHVIPRYKDDADVPRGGIRWILPENAKYWK